MAHSTNGRKEIERVFFKYTELYAKLLSRDSKLTDTQRLNLIEKFEMGHMIAEYFYFHKQAILETDIIFVAVKNSLKSLEDAYQQFNKKKVTKNR
ncbi:MULTISPECIES: hypothetical protein [Vagococcus]|uniref:hypothetical protein n=1 Tax=Vagococcus TaxID=2737 RepID=UPI000B364163|nr:MULTISPECIES: hypothetical protein [Vagococcus]HCM89236.1 hypothetical protein [Vagococcus sp.]